MVKILSYEAVGAGDSGGVRGGVVKLIVTHRWAKIEAMKL